MTLGEGEVLDIGTAGLANPQTVQAKQCGKGSVITVETLRREQ
jgi:hypothetical protein